MYFTLRHTSGADYAYCYFGSAPAAATAAGSATPVVPNIGQNLYYLWAAAYGGRAAYIRIQGYTVPNGDS